jgi:hypothetical protein
MGNVDFKNHSKIYYWWQNKKELWYYLWKGKFFVCKTLVNDKKEMQSEWYLYANGRTFEWRAEPQVYFGLIIGALLIFKFRRKDGNENNYYSLTSVNDYAFINEVTNGIDQPN